MLVSLISMFTTVSAVLRLSGDTCAGGEWYMGEMCTGRCANWEIPSNLDVSFLTARNLIDNLPRALHQFYERSELRTGDTSRLGKITSSARLIGGEEPIPGKLTEIKNVQQQMGKIIVPRECGWSLAGCSCSERWDRMFIKPRDCVTDCVDCMIGLMRWRQARRRSSDLSDYQDEGCDCVDWQCTCQGLSDTYATNAYVSWGSAPALAQAWWGHNECKTFETTFCSDWGCTCQGMSDKFGTEAWVTWGDATPKMQTWWKTKGCATIPRELRRRLEQATRLEQAMGFTTEVAASLAVDFTTEVAAPGAVEFDYSEMIAVMNANQPTL